MDDQRVILHHYTYSPYAEKIRLLLGVGAVPWYSVISPEMPPRPNVDPLTGGYRRIPVAQIGADIFCDTALIAQEIACLANKPLLGALPDDSEVTGLVNRAEGDVFFAAITGASQLRVLAWLLMGFGLKGTRAFMKDRQGMMASGTVRPPRGAAARQLFDAFLADLNAALANRDWLSGDAMGYADAAVYHPIWFKTNIYKRSVTQQYPNVTRWYQAVSASGHGEFTELSGPDGLAAAKTAQPRPLPEGSLSEASVGRAVSVTPNDYARVPVHGTLVAMTSNSIVVARETPDLGLLHVHFPRAGYEVKDL